MIKRVQNVLLVLVACFILTGKVEAATLERDTLNLYYLSKEYPDYISSLPDGFKSEDDIKVNGASNVSCKLTSGEHLSVSDACHVKIEPEIWYCKSNSCISRPADGYEYTEEYYNTSGTVEVTADNQKFTVNVTSKSYEEYYAENRMQNFLDANIKPGMTEYEKMETILKLLETTEYSPYYSTYEGMMVTNSGDCWASSYTIIYMAQAVGINAKIRNANLDLGAASGHKNVTALLDGKVYIVEAGYSEPAPRTTTIKLTLDGTGFTDTWKDSKRFIVQYDGFDEIVTIPSSSVSEAAKIIGTNAFYRGKHNVRIINVPATVETIEDGAFSAVKSIEEINVDAGNANYKSIDGVVLTKDGKELHTYPAGKDGTSYNVPEGVETLKKYSFVLSELSSLTLPNTLKRIEDSALSNNNLGTLVIPKGVTYVGKNNSSDTSYVILNKDAELGTGLCNSSSRPIYGLKGSTAETYANEKGCFFGEITEGQTTFKNIANLDITVNDKYYEPDNLKPESIIKDGDYTLIEGKDYIIKSDAKGVSTGNRAEIYGIGNYVGYTYREYAIKKRIIKYKYTNPVVDYTGKEQFPIIEVENPEDLEILYGDPEAWSFSNQIKKYTTPGTYKFGACIRGDNYETVYLKNLEFTIKGISLENAHISPIPNYPGLGTSVIPNFTVTLEGKTLEKNVDYSYNISDYNGPGVVTLTIRGKGAYVGSISTTYNILTTDEFEFTFDKNIKTMSLGSKTKVQLTATNNVYLDPYYIRYFAYNDDIVTVDENGNLEATGKGTTYIYAYYGNMRVATLEIEVGDYLKGDLDGSGTISIKDAIEVLYYVVGKYGEPNENVLKIGDMNDDGQISIGDAIAILKLYIG